MRVHKEGRLTLSLVGIFILVLDYIVIRFINIQIISYLVLALSIGLYLFLMYFFRFVARTGMTGNSLVLAPCDGKVVLIEEVEEPEYFKDRRKLVSVFMSPLNVHINWFPIAGKILEAKRHKGSHLVAWAPKSSTENERSTVVIEAENGQQILVRQIAGAVARRVVCYARKGQYADQNGHLGFIKFGSRVDVYLPLDAEIMVEINQESVGTQTILAKLVRHE